MKKSELRQMIKEEINNVKKPINEGFITNFITKLASLILSGQGKQIDSLIDPIGRREVIKASNDFKRSVENLKKVLDSPSIKKTLKDAGLTPDDFPWYND